MATKPARIQPVFTGMTIRKNWNSFAPIASETSRSNANYSTDGRLS